MVRKFAAIILFLLFSFLPQKAFAAEFGTSYDVLYDVGLDGVTTVTEKVTLKNLTSEYYANQFKLTIGATDVFDIKASDSGGPMAVVSSTSGPLTTLDVKFNAQVAGMGKTLPWTISFKSKDFAQKLGKVWEIRAPKISSTSNLEVYNLTLAVPQSFGEPSLISPVPKSQSVSAGKIFLTFNMDQLKSSGVSANFGANQLFDFNLSYHLENRNLMPVLTKIALPPDTPFQDVIYQRIDPNPINVTLDNDGNYLAWFRLNRNQKIDVKVFGSAKLYTNSKVKNPSLDPALRKKYTQSDKYWEKDNPQIVAKVNEILDNDLSVSSSEKARLIFQFVVNHLKYDARRIEDNTIRLGAVAALKNPDSAICMEFTDLFIALARAAGIPTRELDGYAYTTNTALRPLSLTKDILHSWPEYWDDKQGWVMVDPTWENTTGGVDYFNKLDLNHFVFVIKGSSSESPAPAGSYKYAKQEDTQDVKVTLSDVDFLGKGQIDVVIETPNSLFSGFPGSIKVKVINTGNAFYPSESITLDSGKLIAVNKTQELGVIPPFGFSEFDFKIRTSSLLDSYDDEVKLKIGDAEFAKNISIKPFVLFQTGPLLIGGFASLIALIYFTVLGTHIYHRRIKKHKHN